MRSPRERREGTKEKGMEQEMVGNSAFLQRTSRVKEFTKERKMASQKMTELKKKRVAYSLDYYDYYGQIKQDRGEETTELYIRGHWEEGTASTGGSFQWLSTKHRYDMRK